MVLDIIHKLGSIKSIWENMHILRAIASFLYKLCISMVGFSATIYNSWPFVDVLFQLASVFISFLALTIRYLTKAG